MIFDCLPPIAASQKLIARLFLVFACLTNFSSSILAQQKPFSFPASQLYSISEKIAGDSLAWPVVVSLASRKPETNEFFLTPTAQTTLRDFSVLAKRIRLARVDLSRFIKGGARIFAESELLATERALQEYDRAVNSGNLKTSKAFGDSFLANLIILGKALAARRMESVEAKLTQKNGLVERRKGLLGSWQKASIGDFFSEADGLRTGAESVAVLSLVDGSNVVIEQNTTAIIRTARVDKLNGSVKTDMTLVRGSLLAQLSANAQEGENFNFSAGNTSAVVRSGKFWASSAVKGSSGETRLSNYDGTLDVRSGKAVVTLKKNQGTVVLVGKEPMPPVELLPSPRLNWKDLDTVIYQDKMTLEWNSVQNTVQYQIEISDSRTFENIIQTYRTPSLSLAISVAGSVYFLRLQSIDKLGLRGADSPIYRILRNADREPPSITVQDWPTDLNGVGIRYTTRSAVDVEGETEPGATLKRNGSVVPLSENGQFRFTVPVDQTESFITLKAFDKSGNELTRLLKVVPVKSKKVAEMNWNVQQSGDTLYTVGTKIQATGISYPNLRLIFKQGEKSEAVQSDAQGQWKISLLPNRNEEISVYFESPDTGELVSVKKFFVR
ncbi:MAG: FecR domain-containing protein [Chloroherpetonaceae bacterium]|nr:FecR domain-containing protein [Chloroherpetonaceae bacterium]